MTSQPPAAPTQTTIIHSTTLESGGIETTNAWVAFSGTHVRATGVGDEWREHALNGPVTVVDGSGRYLTPGFIDIHNHGGGGASYETGAIDDLACAITTHRARGTTRLVTSLVTDTVPRLVELLADVRSAMETLPGILGAHLEGPFLEPAHRGAQAGHALQNPTAKTIDELLEASDGILRQITIAPELPGAVDAIERFARRGVAVAVGHTGASYTVTMEAFRRGASILTHAFNGMEPILQRSPGPIVAALDTSSVTIEVIPDGVHVHPSVIRMLHDCAPGRIALVSDSMAAAGAADGDYLLGSLPVYVVDGVARLDSGQFAGSTLTMDRAVSVAVHQVGLSLAQAVAAATLAPARALGIEEEFGTLDRGKRADAVLLDKHLAVERVWLDGAEVER